MEKECVDGVSSTMPALDPMSDADLKILEEGDAYIETALRAGIHFPATDGQIAVTYVWDSPSAPWHNQRYNYLSMYRDLIQQMSHATHDTDRAAKDAPSPEKDPLLE
jgi:hypothetical protein